MAHKHSAYLDDLIIFEFRMCLVASKKKIHKYLNMYSIADCLMHVFDDDYFETIKSKWIVCFFTSYTCVYISLNRWKSIIIIPRKISIVVVDYLFFPHLSSLLFFYFPIDKHTIKKREVFPSSKNIPKKIWIANCRIFSKWHISHTSVPSNTNTFIKHFTNEKRICIWYLVRKLL